MLRCPVPVIAAVEGFAMAGGCELAVLSDFIVAGETAVFARARDDARHLPRHRRHPAPAAHHRRAARQGDDLHRAPRRSARGEGAGLVNHLVPEGQARAKAIEIAATIADNGPIAVRQAKKAINWGSETDLETAMMLAIEAYNKTVTTEDRLEGVRAFNEKRKPEFKGR